MSSPIAEDLRRICAADAPGWQELRQARLFITGGTGFFGCWLLETIAALNEQLGLGISAAILSRDPERFRQRTPWLAANPDFEFICGDVRSFAFPDGQFTHVIHAATEASAQLNDGTPLLMFDTIIQGTRRCLEFAVKRGVQKLLLTSSGAVYGQQPAEMTHVPEAFFGGPDPLDPRSGYAEGKRAAELVCTLAAAAASDLEIKIARCFAFVGPYMQLDAHFAIGNFIRDQLRGGPIRVKGDGLPIRSYMYASDLMVWLWTVLLRGKSGRAYNIGSEEGITIGELAREVAEALTPRVAVEISGNPNRAGAADRYVPSTLRAREELGLRCEVSLQDAIQRTQAWFRQRAAPVAQGQRELTERSRGRRL
jgi:dTDP-glucose 4,6-dehydratase